jgi:hypothetical protein
MTKQLHVFFLIFFSLLFLEKTKGQTTYALHGFESSNTWATSTMTGGTTSAEQSGYTPSNGCVKSGTNSRQVINGTITITMAAQSTSGYTSNFFEMWNASISTTTGNGIDGGGLEKVEVYLSSSATFSTNPDVIIRGTGSDNKRWAMSGTKEISTAAGTQVIESVAGSNVTLTGASAPAKIKVTFPDAWTNVYVKVIATNNSASEVWSIDDLAIK